ncbi:hypothetical protein E1B28_007127 [Marasmius oreades]|uniref:PARP catalytic domain-containing protein n=1 Tax=Marasmius oreades TaxID=181124 RepID=A0A9P7S135_9AGAR|nr:uncharacterized protein E1B28_007127 [Marasmius oreades]KAG7093449.1 hypothetical protein E1B28_007127 [Marasmius oreades]
MPVSSSKHPGADNIEISDSESSTAEIYPSKRRKVSEGSSHSSHTMASANLATMNSHLKGRKRFRADVEVMKEACQKGFMAYDFQLTKFSPGDEDGSFEIHVATKSGEPIVSVNFLISDTSDYPKDHSCFAHSMESDPPVNIQSVIENVSTSPARTIAETVESMLSNISKAMTYGDAAMETGSEDDDEEDYEVYDVDDEFEDPAYAVGTTSKFQLGCLQRDFIDTVASLYRPGLIRFGLNDFCISVSLSVVKLAESIPPRALMAWDRRLLSRSQHLVLLISGFRGVYPPPDLTAAGRREGSTAGSTPLTFRVGLSGKYKPGRDQARDAQRNYGLIIRDAEDELQAQKEKEKQEALAALYEWDGEGEDPMASADMPPVGEEEEEEIEVDEEGFDRFSLSSSLESLMDQNFSKLVEIRRRHRIGWAGAELVLWEVEQNQIPEKDIVVLKAKEIKAVDDEEHGFADIKNLPHDPLAGLEPEGEINIPLTAFCYLIRCLILCTRYCIVCHRRLETDYEALKPYVCGAKLCAYQYYTLNQGPSLEYEIIHNPRSVDLLVSLTYSAAVEGGLDDPLPVGLGLQVPEPDISKVSDAPTPMPAIAIAGMPLAQSTPSAQSVLNEVVSLKDVPLHDFDSLGLKQMRASVAQLIDSLPGIDDMRKFLMRKRRTGKPVPKLVDCDPTVIPAAWKILRWIVGSCTAYLEEITDPNECVRNIESSWRQYRFSVGAPDAEAKFKASVEEAQATDTNCQQYPSLFAFHGSPLRNWHSIIRHGLWFKTVAHGRAYGHGVYMAKEGTISLGTYSAGHRVGISGWRKSKIGATSCAALVEVVNQPSKFVSNNPYYVVQHTQWLICRYLLVKTGSGNDGTPLTTNMTENKAEAEISNHVPYVKLDPKQPITLNSKPLEIPDPGHKLEVLMRERRNEFGYQDEEMDATDQEVFNYVEGADFNGKGKGKEVQHNGYIDIDFEMDAAAPGTTHHSFAVGDAYH